MTSVVTANPTTQDLAEFASRSDPSTLPITDRQACRNVSVRAGERRSVQRISEHRGGVSTGDGCASAFPDVYTIYLIEILSYYSEIPKELGIPIATQFSFGMSLSGTENTSPTIKLAVHKEERLSL